MVRPERDAIGAEHPVEIDECFVGGATRGEGEGVHHKTLVVGAVEVRRREKDGKSHKRKIYAGRLRLAIARDRSAKSLVPFVTANVVRGAKIKTDAHDGYRDLCERHGYSHEVLVMAGNPENAEKHLPMIPPRLQQPEDLARRNASRPRRAPAPSSLLERVRLPVQPALLSDELVQFRLGNLGARRSANVRAALLGRVDASAVKKS
jgi:hypothetical protein